MLEYIIFEIDSKVGEIKYNPHHDAHGRFTSGGSAYISIAKDGTRTLGPKHPDHPDNKKPEPKPKKPKVTDPLAGKSISLDGLHPEFQKQIREHIKKLAGMYPDVMKESIVKVDAGNDALWKDHGKAFAVHQSFEAPAGKSISIISVNPKYFGLHPDQFRKITEKCVKSGFHPEGTEDPMSIITHEFGHAIHHDLMGRGANKSIYKEIGKNNEGRVSYIINTFTKKFEKEGNEVSGYAASPKDQFTRQKEQFAEAFSSLHHSAIIDQKPYTKRLGGLLRQLYPGGKSAFKKASVVKTKEDHDKIKSQFIPFYQKYLQ